MVFGTEIKKVKQIKKIILATTINDSDNVLVSFAKKIKYLSLEDLNIMYN